MLPPGDEREHVTQLWSGVVSWVPDSSPCHAVHTPDSNRVKQVEEKAVEL